MFVVIVISIAVCSTLVKDLSNERTDHHKDAHSNTPTFYKLSTQLQLCNSTSFYGIKRNFLLLLLVLYNFCALIAVNLRIRCRLFSFICCTSKFVQLVRGTQITTTNILQLLRDSHTTLVVWAIVLTCRSVGLRPLKVSMQLPYIVES